MVAWPGVQKCTCAVRERPRAWHRLVAERRAAESPRGPSGFGRRETRYVASCRSSGSSAASSCFAASYSGSDDTVLVALHGAAEGTREAPLYRHLHAVLPRWASRRYLRPPRRGRVLRRCDARALRRRPRTRSRCLRRSKSSGSASGDTARARGSARLPRSMSDRVAFLVCMASAA